MFYSQGYIEDRSIKYQFTYSCKKVWFCLMHWSSFKNITFLYSSEMRRKRLQIAVIISKRHRLRISLWLKRFLIGQSPGGLPMGGANGPWQRRAPAGCDTHIFNISTRCQHFPKMTTPQILRAKMGSRRWKWTTDDSNRSQLDVSD